MKLRLDFHKIASSLGAEGRGKVGASGGYFGALALTVVARAGFDALDRGEFKEFASPDALQGI